MHFFWDTIKFIGEILWALVQVLGIVVGVAVFIVAIIVVNVIIDGWVLATLWIWLIIPTFSVPELTIAQAIGLALVVTLVSQRYSKINEIAEHLRKPKKIGGDWWKEMKRGLWDVLAWTFVRPFLLLLFGWIVKSFI